MGAFLAAWHFLTLVPLPWKGLEHTEADSGERVAPPAFYPLVGLILGLLLAFAAVLFSRIFSQGAAALLAVFLLALLSGAIHLDGFADTIDGFAGGRDRDEILSIMRDGRIGTMAVIGLFFLLSGKVVFLNHLDGREFLKGLIAMPVVGRWAMVLGAHLAPYARSEGLGKGIIGSVSNRDFGIASLSCGLVLLAAFHWRGVLILFFLVFAAMGAVRFFERRLGGMTGDTVGAVGEGAELLFLFLLLVFSKGA